MIKIFQILIYFTLYYLASTNEEVMLGEQGVAIDKKIMFTLHSDVFDICLEGQVSPGKELILKENI